MKKLLLIFALVFTFLLTWFTSYNVYSQDLKFPEWDGIYLWTTDNTFEELKPFKYGQNIYPANKIQGLFIKGQKYVNCVKLYKGGIVKLFNKFPTLAKAKNNYIHLKIKSMENSVLIKFDNFVSDFGTVEQEKFLLIQYECSKNNNSDDDLWVVGAKTSQ